MTTQSCPKPHPTLVTRTIIRPFRPNRKRSTLLSCLIVAGWSLWLAPFHWTGAATPGPPPSRAFVVAIDAGHGGKDIGATGPGGIHEKDVVLSVARKLESIVRKDPAMKAVMIRTGDQFIELHQRAQIAQKAHADLFISLHADSYESGEAQGSSVFTLSDTEASSEAARCLADRENNAELAGINIRQHEKLLASVLVDLSKNATLEASDIAARKVLDALEQGFTVHNPSVQKAGFAVLKSLDVPSMLIESAFISNPDEERKLNNPAQQQRLAVAVYRGIRAYMIESRPDLAERLLSPPAASHP